MSEFFGYNAERGTWYEVEDDGLDGDLTIATKQDVEPVLEYTKTLRNSGAHDKVGDFSYYACIPAHVELALLDKGININNKHQTKEMIRAIEQDYPYCKVTNLKHG